MLRFKIISLYIYKDLRLRSNESRNNNHEDGNLVPSPPCGCFSALKPKINHFGIHKKCYFPVKFVVYSLIIFVNDCGSGSVDVTKMEDPKIAYAFLAWLHPFMAPRNTKSNVENVDDDEMC